MRRTSDPSPPTDATPVIARRRDGYESRPNKGQRNREPDGLLPLLFVLIGVAEPGGTGTIEMIEGVLEAATKSIEKGYV